MLYYDSTVAPAVHLAVGLIALVALLQVFIIGKATGADTGGISFIARAKELLKIISYMVWRLVVTL